jgi:hypothetical protein
MARSRITADDVADFALASAAKNELYSVPHGDARWAWRLKRVLPETFHRNAMRAVASRLGSRLDEK